MLRKCLWISFVLLILSSCTTSETPIPVLPITTASTSEPLPTVTSTVDDENAESGITIIGVVMDISLSARIITLKDSVESIHVIALTENCELTTSNGEKIELRDIQPGMSVRASGQLGESDALLASFVLVQ